MVGWADLKHLPTQKLFSLWSILYMLNLIIVNCYRYSARSPSWWIHLLPEFL
jgi:hypothetical protein